MQIIKKIFRKTQFLILCLTCILIFVSLSIGYVERIYQMNLEANNFKTDNHVMFIFDEKNVNTNDITKILKNMQSENNIILTHEASRIIIPGASQLGIYFNGIYKNGYNLLEGRFFTKEDFKNNKKLVIIGKKLLDNVEYKNGLKYISRGKDEFLVIGVIGKKNIDTQYDSKILYNLNIDFSEDNKEYLFQRWNLDSLIKNKDSLKNIIDKVNYNYKKNIINTIYENNNVSPLTSAIQNSQFLLVNFFLVIICIILSLIQATIYWTDKIKLEIGIRKMCGASNRNIIIHILERYLVVSLTSLVISSVVQKLLLMTNMFKIQNDVFNIFKIASVVIFILIIGSIVICTSIINTNKVEISNLVKGKV